MSSQAPFVTLQSRRPADSSSLSSRDSTYGSSAGDEKVPTATHDTSRVNYHVRDIQHFAESLEGSAARAFPNRGSSQRYSKVHAILLHWKCDDLFVLPELEDLESCFREDYSFETETFPIPSDNSHLELMLRIGAMVKEHESTDTLFIVYYGGHAKIDDSRQSTWCATRSTESPWLQWSAIQTLLERSLSDVLILLDCCAGAASATFPSGNTVTETISASSWDAIAPDPGRYSFTSALIEVLVQWKRRIFSAAMLHAEVLARLKHPRPVIVNGRNFEARSTPVHFMMTNNHKVPSIELARVTTGDQRPPSPPEEPHPDERTIAGRSAAPQEIIGSSPNEDIPHVMISLALEDDQRLNISEWQQWLSTIPALAKYVKIQGVFKSHSTLLLLSMPVSIWDVLPEDHACNFVAFIRSNNLAITDELLEDEGVEVEIAKDQFYEAGARYSFLSGTTAMTWMDGAPTGVSRRSRGSIDHSIRSERTAVSRRSRPGTLAGATSSSARAATSSDAGPSSRPNRQPATEDDRIAALDNLPMTPILNKHRSGQRTYITNVDALANRPAVASHVESRLEEYFLYDPHPTVAIKEFLASNLGIETTDIDLWFHHRREYQEVSERLQSLPAFESIPESSREDVQMLLPGNLKMLLEAVPAEDVLILDFRPPQDFERSHINGAINLRAPASFVSRATVELLERALDEDGQTGFGKWQSSKCVVCYDRHVDYPWEAPVAEALFHKLTSQQWKGQCFVLKGHYREFSASFDKHIAGTRMSDAAREYLASLEDGSLNQKHGETAYNDWLDSLAEENAIHYIDLADSAKTERMEATITHQKELEIVFEQKHPSLHRKARDLSPSAADFSRKAGMVEHLAKGLDLMRKAEGRDYPRTTNLSKLNSYAGPESRDPDDKNLDQELERRASDGFYKPTRSATGSSAGDDVTADRKAPRLAGGRGLMSRLLHSRRPEGGN
ncbi:hypothetical protein Micbo1qcDRAFT_191958 [Microdochium bolleyi]|uniref:Homeobox domain-containing protein n=1 Tax=Microdochium bolleyi TaxID=196109 RepID=A0A136JK32_9PEZI|nr:hypothetical protein Micbo1qcDRAFT_191958 [Microdochium bolleyi]